MSQYYNINDLKVRVSDHEPNFSMERIRGKVDVELYIVDITGKLLSVEDQIEYICEKRGYDINDFQEVIEDFKDGSYDKNYFKPAKEDEVEMCPSVAKRLNDLTSKIWDENTAKLSGVVFPYTDNTAESRAALKQLAEERGVSQAFAKKHFNLRW